MTIVLDLSPSIEQELQISAAHDGVPPNELALRLLASALRRRKTARRRAAAKPGIGASFGTAITAGPNGVATAASINDERVALIKKREVAGLSPTESERLEYLQQTMRGIVNQSCPLPAVPSTRVGGN